MRVRGYRDAFCTIVLAFLATSAPLLLRAQMATADVLGTVTDPTGAVVVDAKVTIRNTGTGVASTEATSIGQSGGRSIRGSGCK